VRVLISVAEPSGDRLAAEVVRALGQARVEGLLGPRLRAAGAVDTGGTETMPGAMGVVEVLGQLGRARRNRRALSAALDTRPDLFLTVDSSAFHLPLAREARAKGIRTVGLVSPQLWAWRPGRAPRVAAAYDQLLCLFPFEPALYAGTSLDARWVGHPVVDRVGPSRRDERVIAIFPGSRPSEVAQHLEVFLDAARRLAPKELLVASPTPFEVPGATVVPPEEALARADRALCKSGTVTLELCAARIPFVVAHRVHPLTWWLGRALVRGIRHLSLPNILAGREVVREFRQDLDPARLAHALAVADEPPRLELGSPGVAARVAAVLRGG